MREPTKDEAYQLRQLETERANASKSLTNTRGNTGGGAEARYVDAVNAEWDFRENVLGETGIMRGKAKYRG